MQLGLRFSHGTTAWMAQGCYSVSSVRRMERRGVPIWMSWRTSALDITFQGFRTWIVTIVSTGPFVRAITQVLSRNARQRERGARWIRLITCADPSSHSRSYNGVLHCRRRRHGVQDQYIRNRHWADPTDGSHD